MDDLVGQRIVMAVAQTPFEIQGTDGYTVNTFCSLAPLIDVEGEELDDEQFPNCGLVWWLVRPLGRGYAEPGRLVTGRLARAVRYSPDDLADMFYQVEPDSVDALRPKDMVEIVDLPTLALKKIDDLVNRAGVVKLDHPPTYVTLVRWKERLYGPFRASTQQEEGGKWAVSFAPDSPDGELLAIPADAAREVAGEKGWVLDTEITHADENPRAPRHDDIVRTTCRYELIGAEAYESLLRGDYERIRLQSAEQLVHALGKQLLTRKQQGELGRLLRELQERAAETLPDDPAGELAARIGDKLLRQGELTEKIAHTLVDSGIFDKKLEEARDKRVEKYLQERSAELEAKVQADVAQRREEIDALRTQQEKLEQELAAARQTARTELDRELELRREKADERLREERAKLQQERDELEQRRKLVRKELTPLVDGLREHRDETVKQMLTLLPLLPALGVGPGAGALEAAGIPAADAGIGDGSAAAPGAEHSGEAGRHNTAGSSLRGRATPAGTAELAMPAFVGAASEGAEPSEEQFFARFTAHAEARGFRYRPQDLRAFHLAVKTSDLTVLGGVSGTGKSSLPSIYAEALAGAHAAARGRFLHVGVSPGWLDPRDLLGHVNALSGGFQPAESGLYERVIYAIEERAEKGGDSGIYVVCLDEMNLAHVEHYFAGFLQALSRPEGQRLVRCFEPGSVARTSPFARWPELDVPATMRFVGTVNFDETTRQLSLRLLDRANLIVLRPPDLGTIPLAVDGGDSPPVAGGPVRERTLRSWVHEAPLEPDLAVLVDSLRPHLQALGCPLTPRRYRSICRYVASAAPVCSTREAFDLQIAQRVLPQIRGLYGRRARTALTAVAEIIDDEELSESRLLLDELREREVEVTDADELGEGATS